MSIWGKIIGGAAGFAIGGPLGALVGAVAGHAFDKMQEERADPELARQTTFAIAVIVLSAKMAKADGVVTRDEVNAFKQIFHIPPDEMKNVGRLFDQAKKDSAGFEPYARQVARLFGDRAAVLEELLDGLFHIAKADGIAHPAEMAFLAKVAEIFGFDNAAFQRIAAGHLGPDKGDPYTVLGVAHDASDADIRSAWLRLTRENHPDKLTAEGMPQEFIDVANEKLATINAAYDKIRTQRGIK